MQKQGKGLLVSVEGIDGSGKTTLVDHLATHLQKQGFKVAVFRFPTRDTPIGQLIDQRLRHKVNIDKLALQFLFSGNRAEMQAHICKAQEECNVILFDRYLDSAVAYAVAQGISGTWIRTLDTHCLQPDLCIFLHIDPKVAKNRQQERQRTDTSEAELYDQLEFQNKVHQIYCACYPLDAPADLKASWATPSMYPNIVIEHINAEHTADLVFNRALTSIEKYLRSKAPNSPVEISNDSQSSKSCSD